ncbi:MAG: alpha/beta hydrolase [Clostridia bacterium]|nr:alpha/beta hydrolase [Clostridia bacterium]
MKKEAYFISSTYVNKIHCLIRIPDEGEIKGIVQIAHGVAEHIGRYEEFAAFLCSHGYIVCGNDHLGHGLSVESPAELGFIAEQDGDVRLVDDMHILYNIMHKKYPTLPYWLFGHSMGSLCARIYASHFAEELSGVIFCGTGEAPAAALLAVDPINAAVERFGARAAVPGNIFAIVNKFAVKDARTKNDWLSVNAENVDRYNSDPLCGFPLSLSGLRDTLVLATKASDISIPPELPVMLISGAKDPVGLNGKSVIDVCEKLEKAGSKPVVILYPGDRHEILNEDDREKVFNDVLKFIEKKI